MITQTVRRTIRKCHVHTSNQAESVLCHRLWTIPAARAVSMIAFSMSDLSRSFVLMQTNDILNFFQLTIFLKLYLKWVVAAFLLQMRSVGHQPRRPGVGKVSRSARINNLCKGSISGTSFLCWLQTKHLLTFEQLTCTLAGSSQQDWKGTLDCWGTCRTYGPSLFWALGGRGGQGQEPDRGESSLHRHWPGPGKRGSKSAGTSVHSYWQTTC